MWHTIEILGLIYYLGEDFFKSFSIPFISLNNFFFSKGSCKARRTCKNNTAIKNIVSSDKDRHGSHPGCGAYVRADTKAAGWERWLYGDRTDVLNHSRLASAQTHFIYPTKEMLTKCHSSEYEVFLFLFWLVLTSLTLSLTVQMFERELWQHFYWVDWSQLHWPWCTLNCTNVQMQDALHDQCISWTCEKPWKVLYKE